MAYIFASKIFTRCKNLPWTVSLSFNSKPPADAVARIYVVTDKSIVTVPLDLKDIPLP